MPALLDFLDVLGVLGGGISRLTRILTLSHWRQPTLSLAGRDREGLFTFLFSGERPLLFSLKALPLALAHPLPGGESWRGAFSLSFLAGRDLYFFL